LPSLILNPAPTMIGTSEHSLNSSFEPGQLNLRSQ
jgi:hypothetical protein